MPPPRSWGSSTPQAKPKPKARSATPCGPAGGPARGDGPRCPDTGGGGPSHAPLRPPVDAQSGPRGCDAQPAALLAADPGMFIVPLYSAMRRDVPTGDGQPPVGAFADQGWGADAQGHGPPRGTGTPPLAADGPPRGTFSGAAGRSCLPLLVAPATPPALLMAGDGGARTYPVPHFAGSGRLPALGAAARDAPLPGLAAAAPAAAAPPDASALDHGNQLDVTGGA